MGSGRVSDRGNEAQEQEGDALLDEVHVCWAGACGSCSRVGAINTSVRQVLQSGRLTRNACASHRSEWALASARRPKSGFDLEEARREGHGRQSVPRNP